MNTVSILIIILIYVVLLIISQFIDDFNLRIAYWFIVGLGTLTAINMYLSIAYYIKLRNDPGIPGPRGEKGSSGPKGHMGKCTFSDECGISRCNEKIYSLAEELYADAGLSRKCIEKPMEHCKSHDEREKALPIHNQVEMLIEQCKKTHRAEEDFMRKIRPQIELLQKRGN